MRVTAHTPHYDSYLTGNPGDVQRPTRGGTVLMGGGTDVDEAFRWMIERSGGGDFLILRASGEDGYNDYIQQLGPVDSVESVVCKDREASFDPALAEKIDHAEAIFLAGGDQGRYLAYWKDSPVQEALERAIKRGVPLGGTSAGLAVLGNPIFAARQGGIDAAEALADPFHERMSLEGGFLHVDAMQNVLTDTHFSQRERMGRLVTFLARTTPARGLGVDEKTAVLLEPDGEGRVVGQNHAYFVAPTHGPEVCEKNTPLTFRDVAVQELKAGDTFDFYTWSGTGQAYLLSAVEGRLSSPEGRTERS